MKTVFTIGILALFAFPSLAQEKNYSGTWQGTISVGVDLRIVFHISIDDSGKYKTTADSPDQSAFGLKCDTTFIRNNELVIEMKGLSASYAGKLLNDTTIGGLFTQGASIPLTLVKINHINERKRPQDPKPPFPYKSEDINYFNADRSLSFGATITIPEGNGPFPALLLITGSGPQDRNETILGHKPFAVIADHLTRNGFVVLRVDDRGIGKSTGNFATATSEDFAKDVAAGIDYLLSRPEINKKKLGLLGHSEGGMIAPMVANRRTEISFLVLLAAPGVKITELMAEQNTAIARASGVSEKTIKQIRPLFSKVIDAVMKSPDSLSKFNLVKTLTEEFATSQPAEVLKELDFQTEESRTNYVTGVISQFSSPWFRYFMAFDPTPYLEQLNTKVLALNGSKDIQVISSQNLPAIKAALKKSKSKKYEVKELEDMNHLFQSCKTCNLAEYGQLEETIAPMVLSIIMDWLNRNVK